MTTEIATTTASADLEVQMRFAQSVASAGMLPQAYRGKPADVLLAVGLGQSMGLSPAESLYRIDVIQGTPTASAELIASNVRRAGHRLRVRVDEQAVSATATIIRADDPDYEHTVTRDMAWAKKMGLDKKSNYGTQPTTMLQWRAISAVARMACPEALYGVAHTAEEIVERGGATTHAPAPQTFTATPDADTGEAVDDDTVTELVTLMTRKGIPANQRLAGVQREIGRQVESLDEMTAAEAEKVRAAVEGLADAGDPA